MWNTLWTSHKQGKWNQIYEECYTEIDPIELVDRKSNQWLSGWKAKKSI